MAYIKSQLSEDVAKKIFGSSKQAAAYLLALNAKKPVTGIRFKTISRGPRKGSKVLNLSNAEIWQLVVSSWEYETALPLIRSLFATTAKFKNGSEADKALAVLVTQWKKKQLGEVDWPFSQGAFDEHVQSINAQRKTGDEKDAIVSAAAIKYRRIKEINTVRNDYLETLIFNKNKNILPTLSHRRGVDFFIDGVSYDQKVARSPTNEFKKMYGEDWKLEAIAHPDTVAKYLYMYQDEGRFGADPRLLIIYLDEDVSAKRIAEIITKTNLNKPYEVTFTYQHKQGSPKTYKVPCFVVLLHN